MLPPVADFPAPISSNAVLMFSSYNGGIISRNQSENVCQHWRVFSSKLPVTLSETNNSNADVAHHYTKTVKRRT